MQVPGWHVLREGCNVDPRRLLLLVASSAVQLDAAGKTGIDDAGQLVARLRGFAAGKRLIHAVKLR